MGGSVIGLETAQMNRTIMGETMNQIDKLIMLGAFDMPPVKPYKAALVAPFTGQAGSPPPGATLDQKARSYLHANCAFCHRPDGKWSGFDVRFDVPLKNTNLCNGDPGKGDLGVAGAKLFAPKDAMKSLVYLRMAAPAGTETMSTGRMPAVGTSIVDQDGTALISQWINATTACPQ
jgi:mono/diheme cytochrome c family protein